MIKTLTTNISRHNMTPEVKDILRQHGLLKTEYIKDSSGMPLETDIIDERPESKTRMMEEMFEREIMKRRKLLDDVKQLDEDFPIDEPEVQPREEDIKKEVLDEILAKYTR